MRLDDARTMAEGLLAQHGLTAAGWRFEWDRLRSCLGTCSYRRRVITLSRPLTEAQPDEARVRNTILHEIAHALVGPGHRHNWIWQTKARQIGCDGERCSAGPELPTRWVGVCPTCGTRIGRHRLTTRVRLTGKCKCRPYAAQALLVWIDHGRTA